MADAVISVVVEQLASFVQTEVKLVVSVRKDVTSFTSTLRMLQAIIRDAEKRQITEEAVKLWLDELKDIVYDAEDVLDEWNTRRLQKNQMLLQGADDDDVDDDAADSHVGISKKILSCLSNPCFAFKSVSVRHDIGSRIKEISQRLDGAANQLGNFKFTESAQSHEEHRPQPTSSKVNLSEIFGRDHDKQVIVSRLLGDSSSHQEINVPVISIVGTGGFGKTTLAKLILEEETVKDAFDRRMWVCVSQPFNLIEVAKAILEEAGEAVPTVNGWQALQQCLCDSLKGKQFLLVLDDVWTDDPNEWCQLRDSLEGGAPGSRILVTTRNKKVAKMMNSTYTHILGKLSDDDCWLLFKHIAFHGRQEDIQKLEEVGKQIAEKCKGVPLAVQTVASLVRLQKTKKDWNHVLASDVWEMQQNGTGFLPSLLLSYNSLSSNLKQCFMFCAIFPKDTQLEKDQLVKLWMSQGFLGSHGNTHLEKIGENCFDELAMRSFFQDFEEDEDGNITSCKMHDLVHDFAEFLTKKECFIFAEGEKVDGSKSRHVKLMSSRYNRSFDLMRRARSWDLSVCGLQELPGEVGRLLHLRYLDLSRTDLSELPETIGDLLNLQTLKLNNCVKLCRLPVGIGKLLNLRHLEMITTPYLRLFPRGIGRLRFLRTLSKLMVGGVENKIRCSLGELKHLNFLQGSLEIEGLEHVVDENDAAEAELKKKKNLECLTLNFGYAEEEKDVEKTTKILEALQPHENLEELNVLYFGGSKFPQWMSSNSVLANLVTLYLSRCKECTELPALGKLQSLEILRISDMPRVKRIGHEFYGFSEANNNQSVVAFPMLKGLSFSQMEDFVEWEFPVDDVDGRKHIVMSRLRNFDVEFCSKLRAIPDLKKCKVLETIRLKSLDELEELEEGEEVETGGDDADFPCLREVNIYSCRKLKRIPAFMFPRTLKQLAIENCPNLRGIQPCLPPLLEMLTLKEDVGIFSESLHVNEEEEEEEEESSQSQNNNNTTNYPHLKSVEIWSFTHPSLPKGFNHLTSIQKLRVHSCESLDFELDELKHLTMLQHLEIRECPILKKRSVEEDWLRKLSHVGTVYIA